MTLLLAFLASVIFIGMIAGPVIYLQSRKVLREQKNFERGLKMVPLHIHLPPSSDDTDVGSRDIRDVTDETISKAEILYGIIASTLQGGFKSKFYGQRHVALEVVGHKGFVKFYAAVPVALVDVVKQAVISAYPNARLEEVADHNIFNKVGRISSTFGGEMTLKENYAYPISTYQDLKRDPMNSVLNALSGLDEEDGVGIQILVRPAPDGWRKNASELAKQKRKGKKAPSFVGQDALKWIARGLEALAKPPEDGSPGSSSASELSSHEEAVVSSIEEKTKKAGFETTIRIITSSNVAQKSQTLLNNVVASFALFDSPGKNGFKWTPAQDIENFTTGYILRFFPQGHNKNILNSTELATLFHFPQQNDIPTSQVTRQESKQVDGPRNVPEQGLFLGYNVFRGVKKAIRIDHSDRQRHMYVVGQTGVGKSVFLENLAFQDMRNGNGFAFIDPHGDTAEKLLGMIPKERTEDVIYFCPAETDYPLGLNVFEAKNDDEKDFVIQEVLNMLYKLYDPQRQGIIGPRYEHIFRHAALTVMAGPEGGSFIDIPKLFRDMEYRKQKLVHVTNQDTLDFWQKEMPMAQRSNEFGDVVNWFVSKFGAFLSNGMMRNIVGQIESSFNLRDIMDNKKILLVNLSKGRTGDLNSKLLGMIFVMKFQAAAMSRANIPESERQDFCLYVDEFQNFSTDSFASIMSEARKFHLNLIVANQFTTQLTEEIRDAVFGNVGTIVTFRINHTDAEAMGRYFHPVFDTEDLLRVPNFNTIVRTLIRGVPTQPFSMATVPELGKENKELADALRQLSAAKFGRPRQVVEKEIFERLKTKEIPGAAKFGSRSAASQPASSTPKPPATASFLDQWMAKRKQQTQTASTAVSQTASTGYGPLSGKPPQQNQAAVSPRTSFSQQPYQPASGPPTQKVVDNMTAGGSARHGELKIQRTNSFQHNSQSPGPSKYEDTIFIDREGNLKQT